MSFLRPLLHRIEEAGGLQTYKYFPNIIRGGKNEFEKSDIDFLLEEGYLKVTKADSFGKNLHLTEKALEELRNSGEL